MKKKSPRFKLYELVEVKDLTGDGEEDYDFYDVFMMITIVVSLIPLVFKQETLVLRRIDQITVAIFIVDYILRWIVADYSHPKLKKEAFIIYPFTPMAIVDMLSILPSISSINSAFRLFKVFRMFRLLRSLRMMRALRAFRVVKAARYSKSLKIIADVLVESKDALFAVGTLSAVYVLISALIIFNVEPDSFNTFFDAVYWATVSLTTVGYGDIYPTTVVGRTVAMISSVFGIAIVALPAGIITAGYMNAINKEE